MKLFQATTVADLMRVWQLTYDVYVHEGYCDQNAEGLLRHYPHLDLIPETRVFIAEDDAGVIQATNSLTIDGPSGLHVDAAFRREVDAIRQECIEKGLRLGASWRIVSRPENRGRVAALLEIIDLTVRTGVEAMDVCLFSFHPRHTTFYRRMLDLEVVTEPRDDPSVNGFHAVLMRGDRERLLAEWKRTYQRT